MLNLFVISSMFFMMASSLLYVTHSVYLMPLVINLFLLSGYSIWAYVLNVWLEKQVYLLGAKYPGEVVSVELLYGVRYYGVACNKYRFSIRARRTHLQIGDKVNVWAMGNISFIDGDNCCFTCDGVVALGCRLLAALSWLVLGLTVCWPAVIISIVIAGWGIYSSDLQLGFMRGDSVTSMIQSISVVGNRIYLDLDTGERIKAGYSVYEMYPVGAFITHYNGYADTLSVKL